jgi:drug/metabolite transporter (DMT)-like permease
MDPISVSEGGLGALRSNRSALIAFCILVLIGGSNAVAVRFSNAELPPFWGAATRFGAAALIFWAIVLVQHIVLPRGRAMIGAALYGFLSVGAAYAFLYWGLQYVQATFTMVVLAFVPLLTLFLAWGHGLESFVWRRLVGALLAVAGILIVVGGGPGAGVPLLALLALLAGATCLAESAVVVKIFPQSDPVAVNAVSLTVGTAMLIGLSLVAGEEWVLPVAANTWLAFLYLVGLGTVVLFYLYLFVLARWTASATVYSFVLFPVVTVPVAALVAGEVITTSFVIGGALGLFGVWLGAIGDLHRATVQTASPKVPQGEGQHARR